MGLFSDVCRWVGSAVSSVTSSAAYNTVKDVAGRAVGWMAEKAEGFVNGVKRLGRRSSRMWHVPQVL